MVAKGVVWAGDRSRRGSVMGVAGIVLLFGLSGCGSSGGAAKEGAGGGSGLGGGDGGPMFSSGGVGGAAAGGAGVGGVPAGTGGSGVGGQAPSDGGTEGGGFAPDFPQGICRPHGPDLVDVAGARVVAEGTDVYDIQTIAIRNGTLYWMLQGDGIRRLTPGATVSELVVDANLAWDLFATDTHVYWIAGNERTLMRAALAAVPSTAEEVLLEVTEMALAVDEDNVYFTRRSTGDIFELPLAEAGPGAVPTLLVPAVSPGWMTAAGTELFYTDYQSVYRVPTAGGTPTYVSVAGGLGDIAVADGMLYLIADDTLIRQPVAAPPGGANWTRLVIGNPIIAGSQNNWQLEEPEVDGDRVYYREWEGAMAWVKTDGSDCRILANVPSRNGNGNKKWVMDATHVYVIEDDVRIVAIPK